MKKLTTREAEILRWMKEGCDNREIAARMHLSVHTVKAHVSAIIHKLNARNRTHLIYLAFKAGLID